MNPFPTGCGGGCRAVTLSPPRTSNARPYDKDRWCCRAVTPSPPRRPDGGQGTGRPTRHDGGAVGNGRNMAKRKQFTFYESFYKALVKLPVEEAQQGAWAIINYALYGKVPETELTPAVDAVLEMALPVLDSARKKSKGAMNSQAVQKKHKEEKALALQQKSDEEKQDGDRIASGCAQDTVKEKENEIEVEDEVEVEIEIEKELEKESLTHMGSVPLRCVRDEFDFFWEKYPLKLAKKQAWFAWKKDEPDLDTVITALERWKKSRKWQAEEGRFIPRADKFLEEKHYLQPPKAPIPTGASGHLGQAELEAIERLMNESVE